MSLWRKARAESARQSDYQRILLIRTDRVGDLILSTPAVASFRRSWPNARISMIVNDYTEPVMRYNPDVDEVYALPRDASKGVARGAARRLGAASDLAVALAPRTADYRLAAWSRAPKRLGYVYRRRYISRLAAAFIFTDFCVSQADPQLAQRYPLQPVAHEVEQILALVRLAGGRSCVENLVLRVGVDDAAFAQANAPAGIIILNLSPRWFAPNFGAQLVRTLIERLAAAPADVLIVYAEDARDEARLLRGTMSESVNVRWLSELPLLRWAAVLGRGGVVITVDTGATHVAAAMGVPVVVLYEREYYRLSSQEWSPWRVPHVLLQKPLPGAASSALVDDIVAAALRLRRTAVAVSTS